MRPSSFWSAFSTIWVFASLTAAGFHVAHFAELWKAIGPDLIGVYTVSLGGALGYRGFKAAMGYMSRNKYDQDPEPQTEGQDYRVAD